MESINEAITIENASIDKVFWDLEGIDTDEDSNPIIKIGFQPSDSPEGIRSVTEFAFRSEAKIYFRCQVDVLATVPGYNFKQINSVPGYRHLVSSACTEIALGHIRGMLIYATSMAGLGTPVLLSGIVPVALSVEELQAG